MFSTDALGYIHKQINNITNLSCLGIPVFQQQLVYKDSELLDDFCLQEYKYDLERPNLVQFYVIKYPAFRTEQDFSYYSQ